jgi:hypothetical protein
MRGTLPLGKSLGSKKPTASEWRKMPKTGSCVEQSSNEPLRSAQQNLCYCFTYSAFARDFPSCADLESTLGSSFLRDRIHERLFHQIGKERSRNREAKTD